MIKEISKTGRLARSRRRSCNVLGGGAAASDMMSLEATPATEVAVENPPNGA